MKITILGSAAGLPTVDRGLPAIIVEVEGELLLFDCGEGTQRQLMRAGVSLCRKMRVFITHLHGDHLFGLPGLIQTMNLMNRVHPLGIFGPPGLKKFLEETTISTMPEPVFDLTVHEVKEGEIALGRQYRVIGALAEHSVPNIAYKLIAGESSGKFNSNKAEALGIPEGPLRKDLKSGKPITLEDGRHIDPADVLGKPVRGISMVYSGDTKPCSSVIKLAEDADLLIHEATFTHDLGDRASAEGHSTAEGAAGVAKSAKVKKLLLTHISARYPDGKVLEDEAKNIFASSEVVEDLKNYDLKI
ncbi:MAG: ribonuclease Z [Candidatus Methanomethylicus sp.]|nr:ribonuclease Z [Candidatus Methanomethylicus sp.]